MTTFKKLYMVSSIKNNELCSYGVYTNLSKISGIILESDLFLRVLNEYDVELKRYKYSYTVLVENISDRTIISTLDKSIIYLIRRVYSNKIYTTKTNIKKQTSDEVGDVHV